MPELLRGADVSPRRASRLSCHICGHTAAAPKKCPACHEDALIYSGIGTEKVEASVTQLFPKAVVRRMDADAMTRKDAFRETLARVPRRQDRHPRRHADDRERAALPERHARRDHQRRSRLHLPDFRAGERTFQLLTQVAGRAGRGETPGEVFVQTFTPFSPSIQFARHHDFDGYFEQEIEFRERCDFPPFKHAVLAHDPLGA